MVLTTVKAILLLLVYKTEYQGTALHNRPIWQIFDEFVFVVEVPDFSQ